MTDLAHDLECNVNEARKLGDVRTLLEIANAAVDQLETAAAVADGPLNEGQLKTLKAAQRSSYNVAADVWPGQRAIVKVSAYEYSVYGGLPAKVSEISPDAHQDERGVPYFRVRLEADAGALGPDHPILPGMVADVDVIGNRQSVLGMILKPLRRLKDNALRQ